MGSLFAGMMEASQGTFQLTDTGRAKVYGGFVAVPVRFYGKRADASMDVAGIDLLKIRDGKIVEVRLFPSDGSAEDAFWDTRDCGAVAGAPLGELEDLVAWSLVQPSVDSAGLPVFRPCLPRRGGGVVGMIALL